MQVAYMGDFSERLTAARRAAGFATGTDAARSMGIPAPTYLAHENGSRGGKRPATITVRKYARKFGVNYAWLADGAGPMKGAIDAIPFDGLAQEDINLLVEMAERLRQTRRQSR